MSILLFIYSFKKILNKEFFEILFITSFFPVVILLNLSSMRISVVQIILLIVCIYVLIQKLQNNNRIRLGNKIYFYFIMYIILVGFINEIKVNPDILLISQSSEVKIFSKSSMLDFYKHIILILFCYLAYVISYNFSYKRKIILKLEKMFKKITIILLILSSIQLISGIIKFPYDKFFRSHPSTLYQTTKLIGINIIRLAPTTPEPSIFSVILIFILSFFMFHNKKNLKYKFILLTLGFVSTSSTFLTGLIILLIIYNLYKTLRRSAFENILFLFISIIVIVVSIRIGILDSLVDKMSGNGISGSVRLRNLNINLDIFFNNIFLGIGFGRTKSEDLLSTWLANIGLIGYFIFILALIYSVRLSNKNNRKYYAQLCIFFFQCLISVSEPYYLFVWIVLGALDGMSKVRGGRSVKTT